MEPLAVRPSGKKSGRQVLFSSLCFLAIMRWVPSSTNIILPHPSQGLNNGVYRFQTFKTVSQDKSSLCVSCFPRVFCYSSTKLTPTVRTERRLGPETLGLRMKPSLIQTSEGKEVSRLQDRMNKGLGKCQWELLGGGNHWAEQMRHTSLHPLEWLRQLEPDPSGGGRPKTSGALPMHWGNPKAQPLWKRPAVSEDVKSTLIMWSSHTTLDVHCWPMRPCVTRRFAYACSLQVIFLNSSPKLETAQLLPEGV